MSRPKIFPRNPRTKTEHGQPERPETLGNPWHCITLPPLITVWLGVQVPPGPPGKSTTYVAIGADERALTQDIPKKRGRTAPRGEAAAKTKNPAAASRAGSKRA